MAGCIRVQSDVVHPNHCIECQFDQHWNPGHPCTCYEGSALTESLSFFVSFGCISIRFLAQFAHSYSMLLGPWTQEAFEEASSPELMDARQTQRDLCARIRLCFSIKTIHSKLLGMPCFRPLAHPLVPTSFGNAFLLISSSVIA